MLSVYIDQESNEMSEVNLAREIKRKLVNYLGKRFLERQEIHSPGVTEELKKY